MASEDRLRRRRYLKYLGLATLGVAGSAGVLWGIRRSQIDTPPQLEASRTSTLSTERRSSLGNEKALVSIIRGQTEVEAMVRKSIDAIGGVEAIISPGQTVVVKPPILASSKDCAPDPMVVASVVKIAREAGGKVIVAESSGSGNTAFNMSKIGMTEAVEEAGATVKDLQTEQEIRVAVPNGVALRYVNTFPTIYNCDVLISVPRLKRHGSATVTISLKNMMGTLPRSEMGRFHSTDLSQCIADLNTVIRPHLTVVDAIYAMTRTGPTGGDMTRLDTIIASRDPVAADRVGAQELQNLEESIGLSSNVSFEAAKVKHICAASALGVGTCDPGQIEIRETNLTG